MAAALHRNHAAREALVVPAHHVHKAHFAPQVVDIASGATVRTLPGDSEPVTSIAVSPNGKHIFAASRSLTTKAWDLTDGSCFRTWKVRGRASDAVLLCSIAQLPMHPSGR